MTLKKTFRTDFSMHIKALFCFGLKKVNIKFNWFGRHIVMFFLQSQLFLQNSNLTQ